MDEKKCLECGAVLMRRRMGKKYESQRDFDRRMFCDKVCAGANSRKKSDRKERKEVKKAGKDIESDDISTHQTAYAILSEAANDKGLDWLTRINAAKALIPYQEKKKGESGVGKKDERQEAATKAAAGKFMPGAPPAKLVSIAGGGKQ